MFRMSRIVVANHFRRLASCFRNALRRYGQTEVPESYQSCALKASRRVTKRHASALAILRPIYKTSGRGEPFVQRRMPQARLSAQTRRARRARVPVNLHHFACGVLVSNTDVRDRIGSSAADSDAVRGERYGIRGTARVVDVARRTLKTFETRKWRVDTLNGCCSAR